MSAGYVANSLDPDQVCFATYDMSLHCLLLPICPNALGFYGNVLADNSHEMSRLVFSEK